MAVPFIDELATWIATNTSNVSEYPAAHSHFQPSFDMDKSAGSVLRDAQDIEALCHTVLRDTVQLRSLMLNPRDSLSNTGSMVRAEPTTHLLVIIPYGPPPLSPNGTKSLRNALLPHQTFTRFELAQNLPVSEENTFAVRPRRARREQKSQGRARGRCAAHLRGASPGRHQAQRRFAAAGGGS